MQTQPVSSPTAVTPPPVPTLTRATMPAVDDRVAADLRGRLQNPKWFEDARLCAELHQWRTVNDLTPANAAIMLNVQHVTGVAIDRIGRMVKPIAPGTPHWPALVDAVVTLRTDLALRAHGQQAPTPPASAEVIEPATTSAKRRPWGSKIAPAVVNAPTKADIAALAELITSETRKPGAKGAPDKRTLTTAREIVRLSKFYITNAGARPNAARIMGASGLCVALSLLPNSKAAPTWWERLIGYGSLLARSNVEPAVTTVAPKPAATKPAATPRKSPPVPATDLQATLVGRPRLLADGQLEATITAPIKIGTGHPLWSVAVAAMNAPASTESAAATLSATPVLGA